MIQSRFRTGKWCKENLADTVVRIFFNNNDVERYNAGVIPTTESTVDSIATDSYSGYRTEEERSEVVRKVHRMTARETGGMPYCIKLSKNCPYMLTVNIDVEDGLVNGAIGILRCVERLPCIRNERIQYRVWLEFDNEIIGWHRRLKYRAHVRSKADELRETWVPIELRSMTMKITRQIKCNRQQFPLCAACALTIHKSQGGTFDRIVYDYHKKHQQQLVYVALSRVTSLEGLFITNATDDFTFYHARVSETPQIREVRNEYARLATHRLPTISMEMNQFLTASENDPNSVIILNMNVQSLTAHATDISADPLLSRADFLSLTETWMHMLSPSVTINGFQPVHPVACVKRSGGVAVYKRIPCTIAARPLNNSASSTDQSLQQHSDVEAVDLGSRNWEPRTVEDSFS